MNGLMFLCLWLGSSFIIPDHYKPLERDQVVLAPSGELLVLDRDEGRVARFSADGSPVGQFARQGKGPGELERPSQIMLHDGHILVRQSKRISRFRYDGTYKDMLRTDSWHDHYPVSAGWLFVHTKDRENHLFAADGAMEAKRSLMDLGEEPQFTGLTIENNVVTFAYNPAMDLIKSTAAGEIVYLYVPERGKVVVFNGKDLEGFREIDIPGRPEPFNEDWGKSEIERLKKGVILNGSPATTKVTPIYPDYFPRVAAMTTDHRGRLWLLARGGFTNAKKAEVLVFDGSGKRHQADFRFDSMQRLVGVVAGRAWLLCFDREEEQALVQITTLAELDKLAGAVGNEGNEDGPLFEVTTN